MVFIIGDKKYDTETAEKVVEFSRVYTEATIVGAMRFRRETVLYRTKKGNWFTVATGDFGRKTAYIEDDESVKKLFKNLNDVDLYNKYFGELEEA